MLSFPSTMIFDFIWADEICDRLIANCVYHLILLHSATEPVEYDVQLRSWKHKATLWKKWKISSALQT
jgi:hypothetical protein